MADSKLTQTRIGRYDIAHPALPNGGWVVRAKDGSWDVYRRVQGRSTGRWIAAAATRTLALEAALAAAQLKQKAPRTEPMQRTDVHTHLDWVEYCRQQTEALQARADAANTVLGFDAFTVKPQWGGTPPTLATTAADLLLVAQHITNKGATA